MGFFSSKIKREEAASQSLIAALNQLNPNNPVTMKDVREGIAVPVESSENSIIIVPQEIASDAPKEAGVGVIACYRNLGQASGDRLADLEAVNEFNSINSLLRFSLQDGYIIAKAYWPAELLSADLLDETLNQLRTMSQELLMSVKESDTEVPL